jgi:hypothetical protein
MVVRLTAKLLGPVAIHGEGNRVVSVDLGTFVTRILLSETYVLQSVQLIDLILLTHAFDQTGILTLFQTGALKMHYDTFTIGQTGQLRADQNFRDNNKRLPLCSYSFSEIRVADQEYQFENAYTALNPKLQDAIKANRIITPPDFKSEVFGGFYEDIRKNPQVVEAALRHDLKTRGVKDKKLKLSIEETDPEDFRAENNLVSEYGVSEQMAHRIIERSILASADLNTRFVQMKTCAAVSGIAEKELPVLQAKFGAAAGLLQPSQGEKHFERVAKITGLQGPVFGRSKVDAEKLLKIRESDDCRAFRDWLANTGSLSDKEVKDRIRGLNARIRHAMNSSPGKTVRLLVAAGLSFAPRTAGIIGLGASVIDTFIVQRLVPRDSVVAFLSDLYPSVFEERLTAPGPPKITDAT